MNMLLFTKEIGIRRNGRRDVYEKLDVLFERGIRILLMGASPDRFLGKTSCQQFIIYFMIILFFPLYGCFEVVVPVLFQTDFLEAMSHLYLGSYCFLYGYQWMYLLAKLKDIYENRMEIESFYSTQAVPVLAEAILKRKLKVFTRSMICLGFILSTTITIYGIGAMIQYTVEFIMTGELEAIVIMSYHPSIPLWGQLIVAMINLVVMMMGLSQAVSTTMISGLLSLEIETQCEVICAAMAQDTDNESMLKHYIMDHIQVIKNAKRLIKILASLNNPSAFAAYLLFALQMVMLTKIEFNGPFYVAMAFDSMSSFLLIAAQGWFSSSITHALESVSLGAYSTIWYQRDKSYASNVLIISQMAQREFVQKIFLGTQRIERATVLHIVQSSYSFYTLLMILHSKNELAS